MTAFRVRHSTTNNVADTTGTPAGGAGKVGPDAWNADLGVTGELAIVNGGTGGPDAATARSNLGLGTAATSASTAFAPATHTHAAADLVSGTVAIARGGTAAATAPLARVALNQGITALTDAATINTDCSVNNVFTVTLAGNRTLANPTNMQAGATYIWIITQDVTGSRTLAYGNAFTWPIAAVPVLSTAASMVDMISALYDGVKLRAVANKGFG